MNDLVFVHIPKTAGTSLRVALIEALPAHKHFLDYGPKSPWTSDAVRQACYSGAFELDRLRESASGRPIFVAGHLFAERYRRNFSDHSFIFFVRDPIDRTWSEYKHFCRQHGFTGSLEEFLESPNIANRQSLFLGNLDLRKVKFFGIQEFYDESVARLSEVLGVDLDVKRLNAAPQDGGLTLDQKSRSMIVDSNKKDLEMYKEAVKIFKS